jgi:hypothetical protein
VAETERRTVRVFLSSPGVRPAVALPAYLNSWGRSAGTARLVYAIPWSWPRHF